MLAAGNLCTADVANVDNCSNPFLDFRKRKDQINVAKTKGGHGRSSVSLCNGDIQDTGEV